MTFPTKFQASSVYKSCKLKHSALLWNPEGWWVVAVAGWEWPQYSYLSPAKLGLGLSLAITKVDIMAVKLANKLERAEWSYCNKNSDPELENRSISRFCYLKIGGTRLWRVVRIKPMHVEGYFFLLRPWTTNLNLQTIARSLAGSVYEQLSR